MMNNMQKRDYKGHLERLEKIYRNTKFIVFEEKINENDLKKLKKSKQRSLDFLKKSYNNKIKQENNEIFKRLNNINKGVYKSGIFKYKDHKTNKINSISKLKYYQLDKENTEIMKRITNTYYNKSTFNPKK